MKEIVGRLSKMFVPVIVCAGLISMLSAGCRTANPVAPPVVKQTPVVPPGPPTSLPSAGLVGIHPGATSGNTADFSLDLFVVDSNGHPLMNLAPSAITIMGAVDTAFTQTGV